MLPVEVCGWLIVGRATSPTCATVAAPLALPDEVAASGRSDEGWVGEGGRTDGASGRGREGLVRLWFWPWVWVGWGVGRNGWA